jgi:hypothetical protein
MKAPRSLTAVSFLGGSLRLLLLLLFLPALR